MREENSQVKVRVGIEEVWRALAKDFKSVIPSCMPGLVTELDLLEGDGGPGSIYLFKFSPDVPNMSFQKERVADYNESDHRIALEVIEGGYYAVGFTYHRATFQLHALGDNETLVDVKVNFEIDSRIKEELADGEKIKSTVAFVRSLETFLLKQR